MKNVMKFHLNLQTDIFHFFMKGEERAEIWRVQQDCTLMELLQHKASGASKSRIKEWLSQGRVSVEGKKITDPRVSLQAGMEVCLAKAVSNTNTDCAIPILYEDEQLLLVNKPHGLLTNSPNPQEMTAQRLLNDYLEKNRQRCHAHTIHRLDRDTSGLLLFAKEKKTALMFEDHWKERVYDRRYAAVVHGKPAQTEGEISSWLKENRQFVSYSTPYDNGGKFALTRYRLLQSGPDFSLIELRLDTGRKNQIRVHMQDLGTPVAGDPKYGDGSNPVGRLCLHAYRLYFYHPVTGKALHFETAIPTSFYVALKKKL